MMARFRYFAATASNEARDGVVESESVQDAIEILRGRGLLVIRIGNPSWLSSLWTNLNREVILRPPLGAHELARLSQEWGGLVEAGIPVEESLALIGDASRPSTRQVLVKIREAVKEGLSLHEALGQFPGIFPPAYRALIQAGEAAGNLGPTIRRLGDDLLARRAMIEDVRNALVYPLFLLVTASVGILVLLLVVVPNLEGLIGEGGEERLPTMTRLVIAVSHALRNYGAALLGINALLILAASLLIVRPAGRAHLDAIILAVPVCGSLVRMIETGRFARTLSALLSGGVAMSAAMLLALQTVTNSRMRRGLEAAHDSVVSGIAIGDAIAANHVFREDAIGLIRVGERTGGLASALDRAAVLHEARAARQLKAMTAMLTPILTIGFGAVAGVIVYAMLSTILGINELAGQ